MRERKEGVAPRQAVTVRMTTAGNSKALPVPAEYVRRHGAEVGGEWTLRDAGPALVYEPAGSAARAQPVSYGNDRARVTVIPAEAVSVPADGRDVAGTFDWSF